jgi:hypothetical protein
MKRFANTSFFVAGAVLLLLALFSVAAAQSLQRINFVPQTSDPVTCNSTSTRGSIYFSSSTGEIKVCNGTWSSVGTGNGANYFTLSGTSLYPTSTSYNIGIGTTTPAYNLTVVGTGYFSQPVSVGTPVAASDAATKTYVDTAVAAAGGYWTLNGTSLYPTSTSYKLGVGTSTPAHPFVVAPAGTNAALLVNSNGQIVAGANAHLNSTSTAFAIVNASSTATALTIYQQTPSGNQDILTVCRGAVTANCQQRIFYINQYGELRLGQTNATGQLTIDANGNFTQIISLVNSHASGATLLSVGGAQGGTLRLQSSVPADITQTPAFSVSGSIGPKSVLAFNVGGTGSYPLLMQPVGGYGYTNPYKATSFYGPSNINVAGGGGTNPSANALTVENGNVVIYNANSWGGGAGSELLDESAGPTTTKWSRSGNFTLPGTTAVFSGAGTGYITQTTGNMLGSVKPNTQYQLSYTITGASGSCSTFINDPTQAATTTAPASIQSHDTSWRRFGSTNYSTITNGTHYFFFRSAEGGLPANFSLGGFCSSGGFTITAISLKEARGGNLYFGAGGGVQIGTSTLGQSGITVYGSSTTATDWSIHTFKSDGTSTFVIRNDGNVGIASSSPGYALTVNGTGYFSQPVTVGTPTSANHAATKAYVDSAGGGAWVSTLGMLYPSSTSWSVGIATTTFATSTYKLAVAGDVLLGDGSGTDLVVGPTGAGKIDAGEIDPVYTIGGKRYATYLPAMTGLKEETTGTLMLRKNGDAYSNTIDFKKAKEGSDTWLFSRVTNLSRNFDSLVALLTPNFKGSVWYEKDEANLTLTVYGTNPGEVSYRLTARRFDWESWPQNNAVEGDHEGYNLDKLIFSDGRVDLGSLIR